MESRAESGHMEPRAVPAMRVPKPAIVKMTASGLLRLLGRLVPVVLGELHHAVLHDVERRLFVPYVVDGALECPSFDALQEVGKFFFSGQANPAPGSSDLAAATAMMS